MSNSFAEVAVPLPLFKTFHYEIPESLRASVQPGSKVLVEFKKQKIFGYVLALSSSSPVSTTKPIINITQDKPLFDQRMLEFFRWISQHYMTPLGEVIKSALPVMESKRRSKSGPQRLSSQASATVSQDTGDRSFMSSNNVMEPFASLTPGQEVILKDLNAALDQNKFSSFLLHGVTGSGKTEIYIQIIKKALSQGKKAIVIVPEISLTPQLIGRFQARFPTQIAILHSRLTPSQRNSEWQKIHEGHADIVIGARSAIFAPVKDIGVIVVDEEHDSSFKQEEKFRYHARDVALVRGQFENALVILGSATPSLETYYHAKQGKYRLLSLKTRIFDRPLPKVELVDLRNSKDRFGEKFIFSLPLLHALEKTIAQNEQALLLLNRRGFAPFLLCQECGYSVRCPHCAVALTVYARDQKLVCHYCSHTILFPTTCPDCHGKALFPMGLGTEKVEEELKALFPDVSIDRMDRSTTQKRDALSQILNRFSQGKTQILIGTQMIAKGHDFPNVTLVGVLLSDISLNIPDFRAPERTFQLLTQVAGRAGRGNKEGKVIIQTFNPDHYSLKHAIHHDTSGFLEEELSYRQELAYPPFSKLIHLKVAHADNLKAKNKIIKIINHLKSVQQRKKEWRHIQILGPAPSPMSRIKNKFRYHALIKGPNYRSLRDLMTEWVSQEKNLQASPPLHIDVDPLNLL